MVIGMVGGLWVSASAAYPTLSGVSITGGGATLTVANSGAYTGSVEVDYGADRYLIASVYSESKSNSIYGHYWTWNSIPGDSDWTTTVVKTGSSITVTGTCNSYTLTRNIYWNGDKFAMNDTLQSKTTANVAVETYYWTTMCKMVTTNKSCIAGLPFDYTNTGYTHQVMACSCNPSIFMQQAHSSLGLLVEDDVYRQQMNLTQAIDANQAGNSSYNQTVMIDFNFGLAANTAYTYRFSLYPGGAGHDYWKFINTVRKDWGVNNTTCYGPWQTDQYLNIGGREFQSLFLTPWFRNQDGAGVTDPTFASTEEGYVSMALNTIGTSGSSDPCSLCKTPRFMCKIESNLISINTTTITNGSTLPNGGSNQALLLPMTTTQTNTIKGNAAAMQWSDSTLWENPSKSQLVIDTAYVMPAYPSLDTNYAHWLDLVVYPGAKPSTWQTKGTNWQSYALTDLNYQAQYMKGEIDYTLDNCLTNVPSNCTKAVYMDDFDLFPDIYDNQSTYGNGFNWNARKDMGQWDGYTVNMDNQGTGLITGYLTDGTLVGIPARAYLLNYILNTRKVTAVTNGHCTDSECRALPYENFAETYNDAVPDLTHLKTLLSTGEPWGCASMASGHLSSPLAAGLWYKDPIYNTEVATTSSDYNFGYNNIAQIQNKYVIMGLRNGQLAQPNINYVPTTPPGNGGYGIINIMYPITPVELHEGYIIGKEKILTAVSGTFYWNKSDHPAAPSVCKIFDVNGNTITPKGFSVASVGAQWKVTVRLRSDWYNTCAIW